MKWPSAVTMMVMMKVSDNIGREKQAHELALKKN